MALVLSTGLTASADTTISDTGDTQTFATEAEANTWKSEVETVFAAKNDGYTYTLTWSGPTATTSSEKEADGEATTTTYGPYDTKNAAESALTNAKSEAPSTDLHKVTFSDISETTTTVTEARSGSDSSTGTYSSETACTTAMNSEISNLKAKGYTNVSDTVSSTGGTVTGVTVNSLSKNNYQATEYTITATSNTYIVVKQGTWYFIWTATDMSAYANTFKSYVESNDGGCSGKTFKGMVYGFDKNFSYSDNNSGTYYVTDNGNGTYTLHVNDSSRISHMDYGTYTITTSGATYSYTITYTIPATTKTTYSFTKTVQEYKYKTVYQIGYTVTKTEIGSLTINKTTSGATTPDDTTFTVKNSGSETVATIKYSDFTSGSYTISNLPAGTYTVTEDADSAAVTGYSLEVTGNGDSATVSKETTASVTITNNYTPEKTTTPSPTPTETPTSEPTATPTETPTETATPDTDATATPVVVTPTTTATSPSTGDESNALLWLWLLLLCAGGVAVLTAAKKRKDR